MTSCWPISSRSRMVRYHTVRKAGREINGDGHLREKALASFGHDAHGRAAGCVR